MRESWTDERLDDFRGEVNRRFDEARDETNRRFDETNRRFDKVDRELGRINDRLDKLHRILAFAVIALTSATFAGYAAMVALIVDRT